MAKSGAKKGTPYRFNDEVKATFLLELARLGSYSAACASSGIHTNTVLNHRKADPEFQVLCDRALNDLKQELITVARRLAIDGIEEKTYDREGRVIRTRTRYDVKVLLRWLASLDPINWSDVKKVETQISGKVDHEHSGEIKVEDMTKDQQRAARTLLKTDRNLN